MSLHPNLFKRVVARGREDGLAGVGLAAARNLIPGVCCRMLARRIGQLPGVWGREDLLDFAYKAFGGLIKPNQVRSEFTAYLERACRPPGPRAVMEIGTANGGTLFLHARLAAADACVISLDLPGGEFGGGYAPHCTPLYESFALPAQDLHLLRADSHAPDTITQVRTVLQGRNLDVLFIDGDHTYDGVRRDFEMYGPLVRPGGIVAFHDIVPFVPEPRNEVFRYWTDFKSQHHSDSIAEFVQDRQQLGFGIGAWTVG